MAAIPVRSPLPSGLAGRTAVLIGGTSGIGLAAGVLLREVGARVVLLGRDPDRLAAALDQVRKAGDDEGAVQGVAGDAADERAVAEAFDRAGQADHVLLTAGGLGAGSGLLADLTQEAVQQVAVTRLWTVFAAARAAAARLSPGGSITLTSGTLTLRPLPGMSAPLALAGGTETLARTLAVELAPARLRVNTVRYGRIDTPLLRSLPGLDTDEAMAAAGAAHPLGRVGTAAEAAATALFLMANNYVTGQVITVDGGESLS